MHSVVIGRLTISGPEDFDGFRKSLAKTRKLVALGNEINRVRVVFNFAFDNELIDKPIRYGQSFKRPSKKSMRIHKSRQQQKNGKRILSAEEIRTVAQNANATMKAMILLGINGGLGASRLGRTCRGLPSTASGSTTPGRRPESIVVFRCGPRLAKHSTKSDDHRPTILPMPTACF